MIGRSGYLLALLAAFCLLWSGCKDKAPQNTTEKPATEKPATDKPATEKPPTSAAKDRAAPVVAQPKGEPVTPTTLTESGGARFEPPIQKSQVPPDAWYCDMGTVHYARMHEGDGKCPVCKMKLVQAGASP